MHTDNNRKQSKVASILADIDASGGMKHLTARVPVSLIKALDDLAKQRRMQTGDKIRRTDLVREALERMANEAEPVAQAEETPGEASDDAEVMSSREIAEVVGARHDGVKRIIDDLQKRGAIRKMDASPYAVSNGRPGKEFILNKEEALITIGRFRPEMAVAIRKHDSSEQKTEQPGGATMSSREIANLTEKNHADVMRDIRAMLDSLDVLHSTFAGYYTASNGKKNPCFKLDRYHTEVLVTGYDVKRRAAVIKRWYDLESGNAQPAVTAQPNQGRLTGELALLECFCTLSNPAPSSRVSLLEKIGKSHGLDTAWLPGYAEDGPDGHSGSMETACATDLLAENGVRISAAAFNKHLESIGVLEKRNRRTRAGIKGFWCITDAGESFGKNLTSPQSPRETQPHWYRGRFTELLAMAGMEGAA